MTLQVPSLNDLRDIAEAPPVSWWPPAPGWWVLIAVVLSVAGAAGLRGWRQWQANAYRRSALRELEAANSVVTVAAILKRTALAAWPRSDVAALFGESWCNWLQETAEVRLTSDVADLLTTGVYQAEPSSTESLKEFARRWIRQHRVEASPSVQPDITSRPSNPLRETA